MTDLSVVATLPTTGMAPRYDTADTLQADMDARGFAVSSTFGAGAFIARDPAGTRISVCALDVDGTRPLASEMPQALDRCIWHVTELATSLVDRFIAGAVTVAYPEWSERGGKIHAWFEGGRWWTRHESEPGTPAQGEFATPQQVRDRFPSDAVAL